MHLRLIKNTDESKIIIYKIARVIYAETKAASLPAVEAMASMISNLCLSSKRQLVDIIADKEIFTSLNSASPRNELLRVDARDSAFQMCLRVAKRMMDGTLSDSCYGATRFHHEENIPAWAVNKGYVAEIGGLLFYQ